MDTLNSLVRIPLVAVGTTRTSLGEGSSVGGTGAQLDVLVLGEAPRQAAGLVADGQGFAGALESATARFRMEVDALRTTAWGVNLRTSSVAVGQVCLVKVDDTLHATVVVDITAIANSEDAEITLSPAIPQFDRVEIDIEVFSRVLGVSQVEDPSVVEKNVVVANGFGRAELLLSGVPSDLGINARVVVVGEGLPLARKLGSTDIKYLKANGSIEVPQSLVKLDGPLPEEWETFDLNIWYAPVPAGTLKKLPKLTWTLADLETPLPVDLTDPSATTLPPDTPIVLIDAKGKLVTCHGTLTTLDGTTTFAVTEFLAGSGPLVPPITAYTGLSRVTRGKTVRDEIIGSGDTSASFQTFALAKSPLTYLATPEGPEPQVEVYVNGELWTRAPSFYGATPQDAIYTIRHDADHQTLITFGDGELGRRLPTGVDNVVATYRYGVGGNAPAGTSVTLDKPIPGIRKILSPLPAIGGRDVPPPREAQRAAIRSTLVLGRLVSLPDFEAEAMQWSNVLQAKAARGWDEFHERPSVILHFITPDAGNPSNELRAHLAAMAEPDIPLVVTKSIPLVHDLSIELEYAPPRRRESIELDIARMLFDEYEGLLSLRNVPIGGRVHRSALLEAIHRVRGVLGVKALTLSGIDMPAMFACSPGQHLDCLTPNLRIGSTLAAPLLANS